MSRRNLHSVIRWVVTILVGFGTAYVAAIFVHERAEQVLRALTPFAVAILAAWLAACFNRRNSYLQAIRDLWQHLIPAAQSAIQYTHQVDPTQEDYSSTLATLSGAIDMTRGVFSNIPSGHSSGLYPYENLKDIHAIVSWLNYGRHFRRDQASTARRCITQLWQETHNAMLGEFDRDVPMTPVSKYFCKRSQESLADLLREGRLEDSDLEARRASRPRCERGCTRCGSTGTSLVTTTDN